MGESFKFRTDALELVLGRLPNTMLLACSSMLLSMLVSVPLGILAASYKGRLPDAISSTAALLGISMPSFWLGVILILVFAGSLRVLPASGSGTWKHLVLPTITVSAFATGLLIRLVRRSVADTLGQAYVTTARSKGLSERAIAWTHVLRNSAIPVVTVMGLQFGALLGGSVVVETVFAWPGVGWLMIQSIEARDLPGDPRRRADPGAVHRADQPERRPALHAARPEDQARSAARMSVGTGDPGATDPVGAGLAPPAAPGPAPTRQLRLATPPPPSSPHRTLRASPAVAAAPLAPRALDPSPLAPAAAAASTASCSSAARWSSSRSWWRRSRWSGRRTRPSSRISDAACCRRSGWMARAPGSRSAPT